MEGEEWLFFIIIAFVIPGMMILLFRMKRPEASRRIWRFLMHLIVPSKRARILFMAVLLDVRRLGPWIAVPAGFAVWKIATYNLGPCILFSTGDDHPGFFWWAFFRPSEAAPGYLVWTLHESLLKSCRDVSDLRCSAGGPG